jgi:glycosyltransferase involved in cell wall biosynthesis
VRPVRRYIIISSPSYGGAEKRFFDVFTSLSRNGGDVIFVAPERLIQQLKLEHPDRGDVFNFLIGLPIDKWSRLAFVLALRRLLRTISKGASYHYPLNCLWPLHLGRGDHVSMSMVDCTRVPALFGGTVASAWSWLSFFFVEKIDVLSPSIFEAMQRYSTAPKMSLTPGGTYIVRSNTRVVCKEPSVVFLSRLIPGKGVEDFLSVLPKICNDLRERGSLRMTFQIAGYGSLEPWVIGRVAELTEMGIPISFIGYATADELFTVSSVVLSMQDITNYPSRVVAEALMAGCGVIVRDTGDSRKFGNDVTGLLYCGEQLDAQELARQIELLLGRVLSEVGFQELVRRAARDKFSSNQYIDYFRCLMTRNTVSADGEIGKLNL